MARRDSRIIGYLNTLLHYYPEFDGFYRKLYGRIRVNRVLVDSMPPDSYYLEPDGEAHSDYIDLVIPHAIRASDASDIALPWLPLSLLEPAKVLRACCRVPLSDDEIYGLNTVLLIAAKALERKPVSPLFCIFEIITESVTVSAPPILTKIHAMYMRAVQVDVTKIEVLETQWSIAWLGIMGVTAWCMRELSRQLNDAPQSLFGVVEQILLILDIHKASKIQKAVAHAVLAAIAGYQNCGIYNDPEESIIDLLTAT